MEKHIYDFLTKGYISNAAAEKALIKMLWKYHRTHILKLEATGKLIERIPNFNFIVFSNLDNMMKHLDLFKNEDNWLDFIDMLGRYIGIVGADDALVNIAKLTGGWGAGG